MRYVYGIMITVLLLSIFEFSRRKHKDLFSPLCVFSVMQFLFYVPSIVFAEIEYKQALDETNLFPVFVFEIIFIMSVLYGYYMPRLKNGNKCKVKTTEINTFEKVPRLRFIMLVYLIGFSSKLYTVVRSGGILAIIQNPALAYLALTSGSGYLEIMKYFVYISIILIIYRYSRTKRKADLVITFFMLMGYVILDLLYSRRSITITFGIIILFSVNYFFKGLKIRTLLKPKFVLLIFTLSAIIVVLPNFRSSSFLDNDFELSEVSILQSFTEIITRFSMVGRDTFVYNYFNIDTYWLGKSYLNLPVVFVPSRIWVGKPAVDEGVYLTNLINGIQVSPNQSFRSLPIKYSIPFTTQGLLYANFGAIGIVIGGMIIGYIYKSSYSKIKSKNKSVFNLMIYRMIIFELGLTVMTLTNILIQLIIIKAISSQFSNNRYKKYQKQIRLER